MSQHQVNYLREPEGLSAKGKQAYEITRRFINNHNNLLYADAPVFYSPQHWRDRGEQYCLKAELVTVYDGGTLSSMMQLGAPLYETYQRELSAAGLFVEEGTH